MTFQLNKNHTSQLASAIEMAMDAAYADSTDALDVHYDVRVSDRGIYIVEREHEDGAQTLWSTADGGSVDPLGDAERIIDQAIEQRFLTTI